jgi:hypothetical protein
MLARRSAQAVAVLVAVTIVFVLLARPPAVTTATTDQVRELVSAIAPHGLRLDPIAEPEGLIAYVASPVGRERAASAAVASYGPGRPPVVYEGILTWQDFEPSIVDRPVYVVQLTGLSIPAFGPATDRAHTERLVVVDAATGQELGAISVR